MNVQEYLSGRGYAFQVSEHEPVYTAGQLATVEHVPPQQVAKTVVVRADNDRFYLCVLPADRKVNLYALQQHLEVRYVRLATESEMESLFADAEVGAEPPFGELYNLPTLMDKSLAKDKEIVFCAGRHDRAIRMAMADYKRLAKPTVLKFSYPEALDEIESLPLDPFFYDPFMM
ncbi:MAG TPA: YbaK/EbsC family protein [Phycisphaerales bacterium]|nr:YbaK/EbsC family protein [Phycisphaerales bacterium]